jgi:hypothetical protein
MSNFSETVVAGLHAYALSCSGIQRRARALGRDSTWAKLTTFSSALEADMAVSRLEAAEIPAVARGNDIVGIFGPGFQGPTAKGVDVLVPVAALDTARQVLGLEQPPR